MLMYAKTCICIRKKYESDTDSLNKYLMFTVLLSAYEVLHVEY